MLQARNLSLDTGYDEPSPPDSPKSLVHSVLGLARRQIWVILSSLVLALLAGTVYALLSAPIFTASATMLIDPRKGGVQQKSVLGDAPSDAGWIDSQIGILMLERPKIGTAVAKNLHLTKDPNFFDDGSNSS